MHRFTVWKLAACGLLAACGCAQNGAVMRGQSPTAVQQAQFGHHGSIHEAAHDHLYGYNTTHFNMGPNGPYQAGGYTGVPGCPQPGMYHGAACPPGGHGCPTGHCGNGHCGNGQVVCQPHHGYTYSYKAPSDLSYPSANVPGGAVIYPYYTHKGPSDFFRKE